LIGEPGVGKSAVLHYVRNPVYGIRDNIAETTPSTTADCFAIPAEGTLSFGLEFWDIRTQLKKLFRKISDLVILF